VHATSREFSRLIALKLDRNNLMIGRFPVNQVDQMLTP